MSDLPVQQNPADTLRNDNVVVTPKTTLRRRFDVIMTLSLRRMSTGHSSWWLKTLICLSNHLPDPPCIIQLNTWNALEIIQPYLTHNWCCWSGRLTAFLSNRITVFPIHDDVIKWKNFPRYWSFVRKVHRSWENSPHKGQWGGTLMFSLICARINGWINNREAGDLRRHRVAVITNRIQMLSVVDTNEWFVRVND